MKLRIVILTALILAFNVAAFSQKTENNTTPLTVGAVAPDFTLSGNADGEFTLSEANKLTVLVFYRGYW